ncbi:MAG: sugar ABC transporter ATP-binding protein [Rhodovulum sulfidophilum]|uniref:Sugar ABC transporter ATP-binding protein n=1 Tax=Rhodovulum sulfidophilum TaxID=35806 RepID=A0A2W5PYP9_RHOSU|nr:MAG: sugar ABC transporter ATP-binding protein [Rhodovulum sulfidophilum]
MAHITLNEVSKSYGALDILKGISIEIGDGEMLVLVGPSGCGKSTLLRMIAGLEEISAGEVSIDGKVVNGVEPRLRDVAMVFQSYALYPHKTVLENITFGLKMRGATREEMRRRAEKASSMLGLSDYLARYPRQLSGGQRQRVAMGRALVREPKAFLFDEPLSNLDAQLRVQMRTEIRELQRTLGVTSIYVTHDQVEAMTMGDRIVVMDKGHVAQIGSPLELYDRPANTFVARFIGSPAINLIDAEILADGGVGFEGGMTVPGGGAGLPPGTRLVAGVRPEHVRVGDEGCEARVELVEHTGLDTLLVVTAGGQSVRALTRERLAVRRGETVRISVAPERLHLFDAQGHARLEPSGAS